MDNNSLSCIVQYIDTHYSGGLIGISTLSKFCQLSEGEIYKSLIILNKTHKIEIIKRYYCPEYHRIYTVSPNKSYCRECDLYYPNHNLDLFI